MHTQIQVEGRQALERVCTCVLASWPWRPGRVHDGVEVNKVRRPRRMRTRKRGAPRGELAAVGGGELRARSHWQRCCQGRVGQREQRRGGRQVCASAVHANVGRGRVLCHSAGPWHAWVAVCDLYMYHCYHTFTKFQQKLIFAISYYEYR